MVERRSACRSSAPEAALPDTTTKRTSSRSLPCATFPSFILPRLVPESGQSAFPFVLRSRGLKWGGKHHSHLSVKTTKFLSVIGRASVEWQIATAVGSDFRRLPLEIGWLMIWSLNCSSPRLPLARSAPKTSSAHAAITVETITWLRSEERYV